MTFQMKTGPGVAAPNPVDETTRETDTRIGSPPGLENKGTDVLPVLTSIIGRLQAKEWVSYEEKPRPVNSEGDTFYSLIERPVSSVHDLYREIKALASQRTSCVVRGNCIHTDPEMRKSVRRKKLEPYSAFEDCQRYWISFDSDEFENTECDPFDNPEGAVREFIHQCLPAEFHRRTCVVAISGGFGHPLAGRKLKIHLWFWLRTPCTSAQLEAWGAALTFVDTSFFDPIQKHFTANPVIPRHLVDPVKERVLLIEGESDVVDLVLTEAQHEAVATSIDPKSLPDGDLEKTGLFTGLLNRGAVRERRPDGGYNIDCIFPHRSPSGPSSTVLFSSGRYHCSHESCGSHAFFGAVEAELGISLGAKPEDFENVTQDPDVLQAADDPPSNNVQGFYAYLPSHDYIDIKTATHWPAVSINAALAWPIGKVKVKGRPKKAEDDSASPEPEYEDGPVAPARWLDQNRPVHQLGWLPGRPRMVRDTVMMEGGAVSAKGRHVFNLYRPPAELSGDAAMAGPWVEHVQRVYPEHAEHLFNWFAAQVQDVAGKVNHCIVLGGTPGIGKDSILVPVRGALGGWNCSDISPSVMLGRFNGWLRAKLVVVSEARDLGEANRFQFYEASKVYMAAPPDMLRVDEKNRPEYYVQNVLGMVITTNNRGDALYLPADDRRHFVAWSEARKEDFSEGYWRELYGWYEAGGIGHVAAWLKERDLSGFNAKAAPVLTKDFWHIVSSGEAPENGEFRDLIEAVPVKDAFTLGDLETAAAATGQYDLHVGLREHKQRPAMKHKLLRLGFGSIRNPDAKDGLWKVDGRRQVIYAPLAQPVRQQVQLCRVRQQLADFC